MDQNITIPASTYLDLCMKIEDFERSLLALRGISGGLHYAINEEQVSGESLENLIDMLADRLDAELSTITEEFLKLRRSA